MFVLALICIIFALIYAYFHRSFEYWKHRGVIQITPSFPFGHVGHLVKQEVPIGKLFSLYYSKADGLPLLGLYAFTRPILLINDPELIKDVLIRDFQHFTDRSIQTDTAHDPLSANLFASGGEKWRNLRTKLTPTFTSGKLKGMFPTLLEIGEILQKYMEKFAENGETVEIRDILARYNTNIIASVAFGLDIDCITNPNHKFREIGRKIFGQNIWTTIRIVVKLLMPETVSKFLNLKIVDQDVEDFIINMVKETIDYREKNNVVRKDFIQLLLQLRNTGTVSIDERWDLELTNEAKKFTLNEIAAQAFIFYFAGFETSSTTLSFCLYELSKNQNIQRKVQEEIDNEAKDRGDRSMTYDDIMTMKYLENCIDEALRKYPPAPILNRKCTKDYKFKNLNVMVEKNTPILISVLGLQRDPKYYPEPMVYRPERFEDEDINEKPYMPFGEGPRQCIGLRMGKMMTKVGLCLMLSQFNFELMDEKPLEMDTRVVILTPLHGINLRVTKRIIRENNE